MAADDNTADRVTSWLIPKNEISESGPERDGIPALMNTLFFPVSDFDYPDPSDRVIGIRFDDDIRAYPHTI